MKAKNKIKKIKEYYNKKRKTENENELRRHKLEKHFKAEVLDRNYLIKKNSWVNIKGIFKIQRGKSIKDSIRRRFKDKLVQRTYRKKRSEVIGVGCVVKRERE